MLRAAFGGFEGAAEKIFFWGLIYALNWANGSVHRVPAHDGGDIAGGRPGVSRVCGGPVSLGCHQWEG